MNIATATEDIHYDDRQSALVVSDDSAAASAARTAARDAGVRVVGAVAMAEAVAWLADAAGPDIIVIETAGADFETADRALETIDVIARERAIDVVVAMADGDIDPVAAQLFGPHARLLDQPDVAQRVAALRWAGGMRGARLHDSSRDADERLRRLNEEVARFADTLARLGAERAPPGFGQVRDGGTGFRTEPPDEPVGATDPAEVRDVIRARRMRAGFFADDLFADPGWDMLLDLFAADLEHRRVSVSSLCIAAAVPGTTALRWIGSMVEAGLFERYADPHDRRRAFITLSAEAQGGMQRYFHAVRRAGLAPA
ncbi:MarR family winged helix-turn-helix transcriptional regulator [Sphingomonas sp.]|uniref:MarR family winged helix-turn-helix transcriptional regulator n=1 Tax=Sphingomonas sp. TaxID=28214 RepID=UPI002DD62880|nr:MarR family winged helix-turn-helix transcriptional regulator [Sphingomonas sp.]